MTPTVAETIKSAKPAREQKWAPRIWQGCLASAWLRLLARNRFAVDWTCSYIAVVVTIVSCFHTLLRFLQQLIFGRAVARTSIREAPIFIIGHWRTGTTFLHELLILDERHTFPNTYQCLEPNHFLLTEKLITRGLPFLMPSRRPMDNMRAGWDRPQEDEFALCMMGQPSPYLTIGFPNHPPVFDEYFDLETVPAPARESWKKVFYRYLQQLTYKDPRRLILKSPPHTCRIKILLEMFPDASFVHIVRNPYVLFPSTVNMWKALYRAHGMQKPTFQGLHEYVLNCFNRLYETFEKTRQLIPPGHFCEIRYEDLVADPVGQMESLYTQLGLNGFDRFLPRLQSYLANVAGYETNRYELSPEMREEIGRRWATVIERYQYEPDA
jgi:omega-hydroxy-beta-dihydromenaquinone-9 sulfotransferase